MNTGAQILLAALVAVLLLLLEHWGPWEKLLRTKFSPLVNYTLGVLAINLPLSGLLLAWSEKDVLAALWVITLSGGLFVGLAYWIDDHINARRELAATKAERKVLEPESNDDERTQAAGC